MISTRWTKHLKGDETNEFADVIKNSTLALSRLKTIITEFEAELDRQETQLSAYDTPSWAFKQAHINGMRHSYQRVKDLLSFKETL